MHFFNFFRQMGISGLIDIFLMSFLIYALLVWLKHKKAVFVLTGILIAALMYLFTRQFNLVLISSLLQAFFAVFLIAIIVIFQEELRSIFEQIAIWSFNRKPQALKPIIQLQKEVETLVRTLRDLAREKIGALIIIKGQNVILRHLKGGIDLNGELSEALLKSLFDPHSMGHDGAVIIEGNRLIQFGCHLPLSHNFEKLSTKGTRHAAALGLSELSDALCLVVSEEKGIISVAQNGNIFEVRDPQILSALIEKFYRKGKPSLKPQMLKRFFKRNYKEKIAAVTFSLALWFVLVHQSNLIHKTFNVPIEYPEFASDLVVEEVDPKEAQITLSGPRNTFHFISEKDVRLSLKLVDLQEGVRKVRLSDETNLFFPKELMLENIEPHLIQVTISKKKTDPKGK
ncbi:MAG: hypothetical protein A3F89_05890 [Deltaproteobacteria bacterium RIFCSPLOWO2_12_FULL_50_11]|nr:MAG: hypothetical protein A2053_05765 [Deltaproteobacteria bacterium GWA2_50_8]OGQ29506.1 MAG: hypothetical protein A3B79_00790 [Deltaproteobacteria bacterium RIFCSPHIGHO2_02_FULL_50_15]OGQ66607.1 MAG: hypothetical protein A3F89_05890 [Deltaproteobacteria bacterium RIFCSPLOWO2_12_FULL_50_11]